MLRLVGDMRLLFGPFKCKQMMLRSHSKMALTMVPLHSRPHLIKPCIELIKEEWPESKAERLEILEDSYSGLPCSLILVENLNQPQEKVLAHTRMVEITNIEKSIYFEGGTVRKDFRKQGLFIQLAFKTEEYCRMRGFHWIIFSTTPGVAKGFIRNGYRYCDWRIATIGSGMLEHSFVLPLDQPCPGWECYYREPDVNHRQLASINHPRVTPPTYYASIDGNPLNTLTETNSQGEGSEEGEGDPPIWSVDPFDRNGDHCWIKKAL